MTRRSFLLVILLSLAISVRADEPKPIRVLFIGNSYTAFNGGLYKILPAMAEQHGHKIVCDFTVRGGKSLEWHHNEGDALAKIREGKWDYVILQDYSLQAINKPEAMFEYIRKLDGEIDKVGAKTMLYMTWARQNQPEKQQVITEAYETIGKEVGAIVVPAGRVWEAWIKSHPDKPLHRSDKSHPNANGTWLVACTFYSVLFNESPEGLKPLTIKEEGMEPRTLIEEEANSLAKQAWEIAGKK